MSHFTTLTTKFVSRLHLKQALEDVRVEFGLGTIRENDIVSGFGGQTVHADLVVATRNRGYDIGYQWNGKVFEQVADWYGIRDIQPERLQKRMEQRYAYHVVREKLDQQGFSLVEEEISEDRTIHLTLRRMV